MRYFIYPLTPKDTNPLLLTPTQRNTMEKTEKIICTNEMCEGECIECKFMQKVVECKECVFAKNGGNPLVCHDKGCQELERSKSEITFAKLKEVHALLTPQDGINRIVITASTAIPKGQPVLLMHPDDYEEYVNSKASKGGKHL